MVFAGRRRAGDSTTTESAPAERNILSQDYAIAVDIGGTFTDVTLAERRSGRLWQVKTPTTPADPSSAFAAGIRRVLDQAHVQAAAVTGVFHGTTVATNAILERKGACVGLLTTEGCRYVLHIGRHDVAKGENSYFWVRPPRLVPPRRVHEVLERIAPDGTIERPLDEEACRAALRALGAQRIDALAVCLLHAYVNPAHELRVRELAAKELPGIPASLSCEVLPVFREYERTTATILNAYVMPAVAGYHRRLAQRMRELALDAPLRIMKSNGGMYGAESAATQPIHTALSGPAAAAVGAILVGRDAQRLDVISIDVGGTSADICLSRGGEPAITSGSEIGGLPLHVPMVDVHTIGAGGGSIAFVGGNGGLRVGPESAGAAPGPASYGRGCHQAPLTDANVVLGRSPCSLGGEVKLDAALAEAAIREHVAVPLGMSVLEAADGMVELLNHNMAAAIRAVSVERGHDPREFVLVAGGGGGGLHAGRLAELLAIPRVIVPASAGLLSTLGLLATDLKSDFVQTTLQRGGRFDVEKIGAVLDSLERKAADWLSDEGVAPNDRALLRTAGLRYVNQAYEITVALDQPPEQRAATLDAEALARMQARFHEHHERLYGWSSPNLPVELVNLGVTAHGRLPKISLAAPALPPARGAHVAQGRREVYFGRVHGTVDTPVHPFDTLTHGILIDGPAVIEQRYSTILVLPGHRASLDARGNVSIEVPR
jgi:N-methylhydantoinase A